MRHIDLIADGLIAAVKSHVAGAMALLSPRLDAVEAQVKAIPAGEKGDPGARGEKGADGAPGAAGRDGINGKDGAPGRDGAFGDRGQQGEKGLDGAAGRDGKDATPVDVGAVVKEVLALVPPPVAGRDGAPGAPGKDGADGKSMMPADVEAMLEPFVAKWALDFERRAQSLFQSAVDKMPKAKDGADGFALEDLTIEDDGRGLVTLRFSRGDLTKTHQMQIPWPEDCGIFKEGCEYRRGNGVTWGGSFFFAQKDAPEGKPGESADWRLAIKRGRDGKDAQLGEPTPRAPVRLK